MVIIEKHRSIIEKLEDAYKTIVAASSTENRVALFEQYTKDFCMTKRDLSILLFLTGAKLIRKKYTPPNGETNI